MKPSLEVLEDRNLMSAASGFGVAHPLYVGTPRAVQTTFLQDCKTATQSYYLGLVQIGGRFNTVNLSVPYTAYQIHSGHHPRWR